MPYLLDTCAVLWALEPSAVFLLGGLPVPHKDPFDRMLVCQALYHGFTLLTPDPLIRMYPVNIVW
jgi:PIN domain nuclease of toxin-antitoxin system